MPNGKTHDKITMVTAPMVAIGTFVVSKHQNPENLQFILILTLMVTLAYLFASFMFNGDLDTNTKPYNRWWLFKMIWIPYQLMFYHRSFWTHGIIVGTVVRLAYISPIICLIFLTFNLTIQDINLNYLIPLLIGLELGNTIHTISDKIL